MNFQRKLYIRFSVAFVWCCILKNLLKEQLRDQKIVLNEDY